MTATVCILAGGRGGRIGGEKYLKRLLGKRLIDYALDIARDVYKDAGQGPVVVSCRDDILRLDGVEILQDRDGAGPLAGLYSSLVNCGRTLIFPCDMPFLPPRLLEYLLEESRGQDITVYRYGDFVQPQVGVYSEYCLPGIVQLLQDETYSLFRLIGRGELRVRIVEEDELTRFGDPELIFLNINTPAELDEAEERIRDNRENCDYSVENSHFP